MESLIALRALGALLTYPRAELLAALPEIGAALAGSPLIPPPERARLATLVEELQRSDPLESEARYVELFDRGRTTSLNLFEHVHGDSRDRGAAMVELKQIYERAGLRLTARELPDYLPVVLEYLSCRDLGEARAVLSDCAHILRAIGEALIARGSRYAAVFAALLALAQKPGLDWSRPSTVSPAEAFDEDWAERPAFAPGDAGGEARPAPLKFVPRRH